MTTIENPNNLEKIAVGFERHWKRNIAISVIFSASTFVVPSHYWPLICLLNLFCVAGSVENGWDEYKAENSK